MSKMRKVIMPDEITPIEEYGKIINQQADTIEAMLKDMEFMSERITQLENYIQKEIKRKTFKKYVVLASTPECLDVLKGRFETGCRSIVHVNSSMPNVAYYRLNEEVLANGEVVIITKEFFEKWKRGKKFRVVTIEDLLDILEETDSKAIMKSMFADDFMAPPIESGDDDV